LHHFNPILKKIMGHPEALVVGWYPPAITAWLTSWAGIVSQMKAFLTTCIYTNSTTCAVYE